MLSIAPWHQVDIAYTFEDIFWTKGVQTDRQTDGRINGRKNGRFNLSQIWNIKISSSFLQAVTIYIFVVA